MVSLKDFGRLLLDSAYEWSRHRAASKGAALALYMMFSLAPMLILVIAVAGTFFSEEAVQSELFGQIRAWTGERNAEVIRTVLASARESGKDSVAALLSIVILLFSATTAFAELKASLDELWEVEDRNSIKKLIHSRILSFGLVLMLALFLLFSLTVNAVIAATRAHYGVVWANPMVAIAAQWLSQLFSFGIVTALFGVVYKLLPDTHIAWRHVWPGAVLTAALFLLGKWAIGLCLNWSGTASTYGAAGSLIALLLWIYYSAQIFFLGAVFTRQYEKWITRSD
jgi:membrane protein